VIDLAIKGFCAKVTYSNARFLGVFRQEYASAQRHCNLWINIAISILYSGFSPVPQPVIERKRSVGVQQNPQLKYIVPMLLLTGARKCKALDARWPTKQDGVWLLSTRRDRV